MNLAAYMLPQWKHVSQWVRVYHEVVLLVGSCHMCGSPCAFGHVRLTYGADVGVFLCSISMCRMRG
jgi:hypothetical protein